MRLLGGGSFWLFTCYIVKVYFFFFFLFSRELWRGFVADLLLYSCLLTVYFKFQSQFYNSMHPNALYHWSLVLWEDSPTLESSRKVFFIVQPDATLPPGQHSPMHNHIKNLIVLITPIHAHHHSPHPRTYTTTNLTTLTTSQSLFV